MLCTGRSGSTSFIRACKHITNYTSGHETRSQLPGQDKFSFPDSHIEADNRLSWQLGQLDQKFGKEAYYVQLKRDSTKIAQSYMNRFLLPKSIIYAFSNGIKKSPPETLTSEERFEICLDYVETVNTNIELFLKDKPSKMVISLENIQEDFKLFWNAINAEGNFKSALSEFDKKHNKSPKKTIDLKYSFKHAVLKSKMLLDELFRS